MPTICPTVPGERQQMFPSGRSVILRVTGAMEELEVRSASGETELRVILTGQGPVLRLSVVRLELEATETVAVRCRNFEVHAGEAVQLTGQEVRVQTTGDIHL